MNIIQVTIVYGQFGELVNITTNVEDANTSEKHVLNFSNESLESFEPFGFTDKLL